MKIPCIKTKDDSIKLYNGDCLEVMKFIKNNSIDCVLCDLPYGVTANNWDSVIDVNLLFDSYERILKPKSAIILFADGARFSAKLITEMTKLYRHKWIWNKNNSAGFATVKYRPFQICEDVLVFGFEPVSYYPIMEERGKPRIKGGYTSSDNYNITPTQSEEKNNLYYPKNLLNYTSNNNAFNRLHPTQKPVELSEYLINTYTLSGETVLDNCMGSGSTGIAAINTNRKFIGIEKDSEYFDTAKNRIIQHLKEVK